jgi:hypothetical protein
VLAEMFSQHFTDDLAYRTPILRCSHLQLPYDAVYFPSDVKRERIQQTKTGGWAEQKKSPGLLQAREM